MDMNKVINMASGAKCRSINDLFEDQSRADLFSVSAAGLFLDYSKQNIVTNELTVLFQWAENLGLTDKISAMFSGEKINNTEQRAVLHSVLRAPDAVKRQVLADEVQDVINTEHKMAEIVEQVSAGDRVSASGERYTDVLAIGIGGSYYGIKVALSALKPYHQTGLTVHMLANVDGGAVQEKLQQLSASTTLVIILSKTFSTQETLLNAMAVKAWMLAASPHPDIIEKQWFAVSTNIEKATDFGLTPENILPMWDWVGGRFSLWSAVGLPIALAIGNENFARLKAGAYAMDVHFQQQPFEHNMPVIMALIGIWNRNALAYPCLAVLPYDHALRALPGYLQQTDMESNGKSVATNGAKLAWLTAPVLFGQEGTNGQHAFMQLMHQSDDIIPTDFIVALQGASVFTEHHKILVANCFAQSEALMKGKSLAQACKELVAKGITLAEAEVLAPHKVMKGNTPSSTLLLNRLDPESLGALLALYEHKIFVQGVMWQLNSFDQWGVELGKELGQSILNVMKGGQDKNISASSLALVKRFNLAATL